MTVDTIDLGRHAVIEASAGTGKTHTIEQLVLRLLLETDTPLDKILLVTFTDKATGELKERVRQTIETASRDQPERREPLVRALAQFDQASIFTIHAFCQRISLEHALEQGGDFRPMRVSDAELIPIVLRDVQHRLWRSTFGEQLRDVLDRTGFNRESADAWERDVREVAAKFQPRSEHRLFPELPPDWWQSKDADIAGLLQVFTVRAIRDRLQDYKRQRGLQSFDDMIGVVERSLDPSVNPQAPLLLTRLREKYRFGIVDEFQDTDPLQWNIFRRIFLESGLSRLFVVGDPKQAIFAFRGADLPTYLRAKEEMTRDHGAIVRPLTHNWRSDPKLIEALNSVFGDGDWFPKEDRIEYFAVEPPREEERQVRITADRTGRAALTVVDMRQVERIKESGRQFGRFVAHEIDRLLHESALPALEYVRKGESRRLVPGDICVLVQKRREAVPIMERLAELGIGVNFYKQTGFWDCAEVRQIETVLSCLARPEDPASFRKALLTCFFRVPAAELAQAEDLPPTHAARRLFQRWLDDAESRRWSALFQSMIEDTGLILAATETPQFEMRLDMLQQAMSALSRAGHGDNRDLLGLIDFIRSRRQDQSTETEPMSAPMHGSRVQIMTIHASKGLEFPVVFLAGGFTRWNKPITVAEYRDKARHKVFHFRPEREALQAVASEEKAEYRRLFYVAMTRAIFKLYVPLVSMPAKGRGSAGPVATVLLPALKRGCPDKGDMEVAQIIPLPVRVSRVRSIAAPNEGPAPLVALRSISGPLFPELAGGLDKRRLVVKSFSSMARQHVAPVGEGPSYGEPEAVVVDEVPTAVETEDPLRGPVFGDIVHKVLEAIDFAEVGRADAPGDLSFAGAPARQVIDRLVHLNRAKLRSRGEEDVETAARGQVAQLVWNALRTPLSQAGGPLWQLPPADRIHELEFEYPAEAGDAVLPACREESFIVGFMDLVFRRDGRYFLVDFKTNLLPGYTQEHLERCMADSDYHRQYELYLEALERWLKGMPGRAPRFGGVYYLFLRGMNGVDDTSGVFFQSQRTVKRAFRASGRRK